MGKPKATHCRHGHECTPENTYLHAKTGNRMCRACHRANANLHYHNRANWPADRQARFEATAARLKAKLEALRPDVLDAISRSDITRAATELSAHYPSRFAAPQPCGPAGASG